MPRTLRSCAKKRVTFGASLRCWRAQSPAPPPRRDKLLVDAVAGGLHVPG
jgi:hypothetical protein